MERRTSCVLSALLVQTASLCFALLPAFDAASVKVVDPKRPSGFGVDGGPGTTNPGRIHFRRATMIQLLTRAYDVSPDQISGPAWIQDFMGPHVYEVIATMAPATTKQQFMLMMQQLLTERFGLSVRRERQRFPGYSLSMGYGGPKLNSESPAVQREFSNLGRGGIGAPVSTSRPQTLTSISEGRMRVTYRRRSMNEFAEDLGYLIAKALGTEQFTDVAARRPRVVDNTRLKGTFDFTLEFSCAGCPAPTASPAISNTGAPVIDAVRDPLDGRLPDIFHAIEKQLGLRLARSADVAVDVVVVEKVNKTPTPN